MNDKCASVTTLLFDYGGTLDTDGRHWSHVLWDAWQAAGVPVDEPAFREAYVHGERYLGSHDVILPEDDFHEVLLKKVALELSACGFSSDEPQTEVYRRYIAGYCNGYVQRNMQETKRVLSGLKGRYKLGLVSNFYGNIRSVLKEYGLDGFFSEVVESAEVHIRKPDPAIYALGLERMGATPGETVVVGDAFGKDILPAKQLGCKAVWIKGETWKPEHNDETIPDAVISHFSQLTGLLL